MNAPRFDALARSLATGVPRRRLVQVLAALGLGGALARPLPRPAAARRHICPVDLCCDCGVACACGGGVAGAGVVGTAEGDAQLRLVATRLWSAAARDHVLVGFVAWAHPGWEGNGVLVESARLESYGPIPDVEGGREVRGWAHGAEPGTEDPFLLRVVAQPDEDRVELWAGDAARAEWGTPVAGTSGFAYHAAGTLPAGSLRLLSFDAPVPGGGTPEAGTPAA